jgi:hypothetical protein
MCRYYLVVIGSQRDLDLGERQLGDSKPELAASLFPPPAVSQAIRAIGCVIGPMLEDMTR